MRLVVDANIIMAALIGRGFTLDMLYSEKLELLSPEFVMLEIENHKDEVVSKSGLSGSDVSIFLDAVKSRINIIPSEELKAFVKEAEELSPDPNDFQYFALALKLSCPIWSNDKELKKQSRIPVFTTEELLKLF